MAELRTSCLFAALIAASALAVDPWGWDHYGPLRWAVVSTLGLLTVGAGFLDRGFEPERIGRVERWGIGLLLFGAVASTLLSDDRLHAIVGTPDRHFGVITWLLSIGVFVVMAAGRVDSAMLVRASAVSVVGLGGWTVLELADVGWFASEFAEGRAGGPFGQPAYLGAAAVLLTPVGSAPLLGSEATRADRWLAAAAAVAGVAALAGSGSRAAVVGAVAAVVVSAGAVRIASKSSAILAAVGAVVLGLVTPAGGRLRDLMIEGDGLSSRADEWQVGVRALWEAPGRGLLGWGPEGYRIVFGRFVDDAYVVAYGREVITDRAHSGPLDVALSSGVIGLVGWGLLLGGVGVAVWRRRGSAPELAVGLGVIGYLVQQLLLFPLAELDPVWFGFIGILSASTRTTTPTTTPHGSTTRSTRPWVTSVGVGAFALAAIAAFAGIADVAADRAIAETPVDTASARVLRPDSIRYRFISARIEAREDAPSLRRALGHVTDGLDLSPGDPALRLEGAAIRTELARSTATITDIRTARQVVTEYVDDDRRHPQLRMQAGILAALDGDLVEAEAHLARAVALAPTAVEPRVNLGLVLIELGRVVDARSVLEEAAVIAPNDLAVARLLEEISGR